MLVEREIDVSHCFFVACNNVCFVFTLLSHDDDLHPHEILVSNSMKYVIVQVSWSYMLVCGKIPILTMSLFAQSIGSNSLRGYIKVSLVLPFCLLLFVCMQEKE